MALVDRAALVGVSLRLVVVVRADGCNLLVLKDSLILSILKSKLLSFLLQTNDRAEHSSDLARKLLHDDLVLAARAAEERPSHSETSPAGLDEHLDAACVKYVAAGEFRDRF